LIRRDWSLVIFTTLAQASVGISLCLVFLHLFPGGDGLAIEYGLKAGNPLLLALVMMAVALTTSFLHLGTPLNAYKSIRNLGTSWLSREILAIQIYSLSLFGVFLLNWYGMNWYGTGFNRFSLLHGLLMVSGLALLWTMIRVYTLPTIPPWNRWYTPVSFLATTLSLGSLFLLILGELHLLALPGPVNNGLRWLLAAILLIELVSSIFHHAGMRRLPPGLGKPDFTGGAFQRIFTVRLATVVIILLLVMLDTPPVVWLAVPLIAQEILGRLLFYASYFRTGV
jgi:anaerobic dimethyl sulfoxide reductase subunit C (anchor subunit)